MARGKARSGKRTRRTRQQILLESEANLLNRAPASAALFPEDPSHIPAAQATSSTSSSMPSYSNDTNSAASNSNQKKSLRILFQDAKNGKLKKRRQHRIKDYVWPRTVEAAKNPFDDPTGKNKLFFLLAISVYPENKIIQPSDSETDTDDQENNDPNDNDYFDSNSIFKPETVNLVSNLPEDSNGEKAAIATNDVDDDDAFMQERSPSPVSPKVKRGRRPNNARRIPYGRAADIDHSWRSNYNRRCIQQRKTRQGRNRIKDPQVIQDIITSVIQRYTGGLNNPPPNPTLENGSNNNVANNDDNEKAGIIIDPPKRVVVRQPRTPPPALLQENLAFIKHEIMTPDSSDVEVDVEMEDSTITPPHENEMIEDLSEGEYVSPVSGSEGDDEEDEVEIL